MALAARQAMAPQLNVAFDGEEDVLYVSLGAPVPSHVDEGDGGLLFRRSNADDHPSGVTALDFQRNWRYDRSRFYSVVAKHLAIPAGEIEEAVERAL